MTDYEDVVQALGDPSAYPERPAQIEHIQTHISHLFLTPDYVYKVKKPVDFGFLDFTTLEKRLFFCREELRLNRRTSPDVYLDIVPIARDASGTIRLGGAGEALEHALQMRRLPSERSLDNLLNANKVSEEMASELGQLVGRFHLVAETSEEINRYGSPAGMYDLVEENFRQTKPFIGRTISPSLHKKLEGYSMQFLRENRALMEQRVAEGRVRDCHGDLHSAQVFHTDQGVRIIDCIEFTKRFRHSDVAYDMAFMAMDLDQYGRHDLSRAFVEAWLEVTDDRGALQLHDFYKATRAYVRGKVEGFRLDDPSIAAEEKDAAAKRARSYFDLAYFYTQQRATPKLILCAGLVGTGKSTIARYVAADAGMAAISSDMVRKRLAGIPATERHFDAFGGGLYTAEFSRRTYEEVIRLARQHLEEGHSVVIDAAFARQEQRALVSELAKETRAELWTVECTATEDDIRERLERRVRRGGSVSDGRWEIYQHQKTSYEPITEFPHERHIVVHTSAGSVSDSVRYVLHRLGMQP